MATITATISIKIWPRRRSRRRIAGPVTPLASCPSIQSGLEAGIHELQIDGGAQCFPLYLYDEKKTEDSESPPQTSDMFADKAPVPAQRTRRDALSTP